MKNSGNSPDKDLKSEVFNTLETIVKSDNETEVNFNGQPDEKATLSKPPPLCKIRNLSLKNTKACRKSIARLMKARLRGEIDIDLYKNLLYGMQVMSGLIKIDIEEELEEIKARLDDESKKPN